MTSPADEKASSWGPALLLLLFCGAVVVASFAAGYDLGYLAGQLHELERQIDNLDKRLHGRHAPTNLDAIDT